jgi:hypothetical protein
MEKWNVGMMVSIRQKLIQVPITEEKVKSQITKNFNIRNDNRFAYFKLVNWDSVI